jgi:hypothetical protein
MTGFKQVPEPADISRRLAAISDPLKHAQAEKLFKSIDEEAAIALRAVQTGLQNAKAQLQREAQLLLQQHVELAHPGLVTLAARDASHLLQQRAVRLAEASAPPERDPSASVMLGTLARTLTAAGHNSTRPPRQALAEDMFAPPRNAS